MLHIHISVIVVISFFSFHFADSIIGLDLGARKTLAGMNGGKFRNEVLKSLGHDHIIHSLVTLEKDRRFIGQESFDKVFFFVSLYIMSSYASFAPSNPVFQVRPLCISWMLLENMISQKHFASLFYQPISYLIIPRNAYSLLRRSSKIHSLPKKLPGPS
jgi:hypothetical protein